MVKTSSLPLHRSVLRHELSCYLANEVSIHELRRRILDHLESDLRNELCDREWRDFKAEFSYVIDMYNEEVQPRKTGLGKALELLGRTFAGNYRISEEQVRKSVDRLLKWL